MRRGYYIRNSQADRERILKCSEDGDNWKQLAITLNVKISTAYSWIRTGSSSMKQRGGYKKKHLSDEQV